MVITRKIQVFVYESNTDLKKEYIHSIYNWRDAVRKTANIIVAHKFTQQNIRDFVYIKDDIKDKFHIRDIIKEGKGMSEQNTTYRIASEMLKGKVPSDIYSCLNQSVANTFKETLPDMLKGKSSLRSYKNNIPIPFSAKAVANIHYDEADKRFYFNLFQVPFACALGRDRSNNEAVINACIEGKYKICGSSLQIDDKKKKMFLLLCVDMPQQKVELKEENTMYAFLGVMNPIVCSTEISAKNDYDSGMRMFEIGTAEEYNHRRRQIQEALHRAQVNARYSIGGKGRKRKTQAVDRFADKERDYIDTKTHQYSRMLIDLAVKHKCSRIKLMRQKEREKKAKEDNAEGDNFVLRNWSYHNLKTKIEYKAKKYGIKVETE